MQRLIDELKSRFGVEPADGLQIISTASALSAPFDPGMAVLLLPAPAAADEPAPVLSGRTVHALDAATLLRDLYPADHAVAGLDGAPDTSVGAVSIGELDRGAHFLAALDGESNVASPHGLPWLVARLRAPDGCPWDREQTHQSLAKFLLEEAYEVYDALEAGSTPNLAEELGDLLLQIVLHAHYAAEDGVFDLTDVYRQVMTKIVRRHPHVFGDVVAESAADVIRNWEQIKASERSANGARRPAADSDMPLAFAGLSRSLPALAYAQEMQERAASLGYDWPDIVGILDKVVEEAAELSRAIDDRQRHEEVGDLLLVLVNLARRMGVDAEAALRGASAKFATRFAAVERQAAHRGVDLRSLSAAELDDMWKASKAGTSAAIAAVAPESG
jgi:tetrapyrrole methylase family protein/MazG family protein